MGNIVTLFIIATAYNYESNAVREISGLFQNSPDYFGSGVEIATSATSITTSLKICSGKWFSLAAPARAERPLYSKLIENKFYYADS